MTHYVFQTRLRGSSYTSVVVFDDISRLVIVYKMIVLILSRHLRTLTFLRCWCELHQFYK